MHSTAEDLMTAESQHIARGDKTLPGVSTTCAAVSSISSNRQPEELERKNGGAKIIPYCTGIQTLAIIPERIRSSKFELDDGLGYDFLF